MCTPFICHYVQYVAIQKSTKWWIHMINACCIFLKKFLQYFTMLREQVESNLKVWGDFKIHAIHHSIVIKNSLHFLFLEVFKKRGRNLWGSSESSNFASTNAYVCYTIIGSSSLHTGFLNTHDNHIFGWITCPLFLMEQFFQHNILINYL